MPLLVALGGWTALSASWIRGLFCLSGLLLMLPSGGGRPRERLRVWLLAGLALTAAFHATGSDLWRFVTTPQVRVWNVFHYYLGAEYFGEVGYLDLYDAALQADVEGDDYWRRVRRVRDQRSYEHVPRDAERGAQVRARFSDERWASFKQDVVALQRQRSARAWRSIFTDRGYNASPFWSALARPLTALLPASRPPALKVLAGLDLLVLAATFLLIGRTFGARAGWLALLLFVVNPVDRNRMVGGFLQYDWLLALAVSVCALRRRRQGWAAAGLAYATLVRVFPVLLAVSLLAPAAVRWIRTGRLRRDSLRFALYFTLFMAIGGGIGCLTARGPTAWLEFGGNILHHGEHHTFGEQRVGLKHLFTHGMASAALEGNSAERRESFESQETLYRAAAALLLLLWAAALHRRHGPAALLLGLLPFFALLVSSRYYWASLALVPLAGTGVLRPPAGSWPAWRRLSGGVLALFLLFYLADVLGDVPPYGLYLVFDGLLLLGLAAWAGGYVARDWRSRRRLRAGGGPWSRGQMGAQL